VSEKTTTPLRDGRHWSTDSTAGSTTPRIDHSETPRRLGYQSSSTMTGA
jgi:hypothetical protein